MSVQNAEKVKEVLVETADVFTVDGAGSTEGDDSKVGRHTYLQSGWHPMILPTSAGRQARGATLARSQRVKHSSSFSSLQI